MSEGPGQQQRYCTNCGTEIRPGNSFCVSCGQRLPAGDAEHVDENTNPIKKFYEETQTRYRQWSETQAAERQRNEVLRAIQTEREARRARFDRYIAFFEKARSGAQTSLEWWQAYEDQEEGAEEGAGDQGQTTNELLTSAQEQTEAALVEMRGFEEAFASLLQSDSFGEADEFLNRMLAGQEDFEGEESVFPPLVAVHERIKHSEGWATYRRELEKFIKDLEDLLGSPAVRTAPANGVRFPEPGQEHPSQPEVSYPHESTPEAEVPLPPLPSSEPLAGRIREWTRTASTGQQWMVIGAVFVALLALVGMVVSISNQQDSAPTYTESKHKHAGYLETQKNWFTYSTDADGALGVCRVMHAFYDDLFDTQAVWAIDDQVRFGTYDTYQEALDDYGIPQYKNKCDRSWAAWQNSWR